MMFLSLLKKTYFLQIHISGRWVFIQYLNCIGALGDSFSHFLASSCQEVGSQKRQVTNSSLQTKQFSVLPQLACYFTHFLLFCDIWINLFLIIEFPFRCLTGNFQNIFFSLWFIFNFECFLIVGFFICALSCLKFYSVQCIFLMKNLCSKVITGNVRLKGRTVSLVSVESSPTY